ncbi:MAG: Rossmann-like and DUF2520 domain-containing protein [Sphingobacteriales bacterium]
MRIVIIGSGNTANVLGRKIISAGHEVVQVAGRNEEACAELASLFNCTFTINWSFIDVHADIYIVAITDTALEGINTKLRLDKKLVVHTAGSVTKNVLKNVSTNYGVLYPLQSLRKELNELPAIPFLIDANTSDNITLIKDFAETISDKVQVADDEERKKLHLAAVMVNNFTSHLYALAEEFCINERVDFEILYPLIKETVERIENGSPGDLQTGPAIRGDESTIEMHLHLLKNYPHLSNIYTRLTESIKSFYKK